jgi:hypothetical protein
MIRPWLGGAFIAAGLVAGAAAADFHQTFEARCLSCHGHAGEFARASLTENNGVLKGARSGREIAAFLRGHAGGLNPAEIDLFIVTFTRQLQSGGFFRDRCDICHDRAYDLARLRLILRDGRLVGRYSGRDMASFLPGHARMTAAEADLMLEILTELRIGAR